MRDHDDVETICCKHGKPCHLSLQPMPVSVRAGAEVPKSPDVGGRRKKQQPSEKNSSITDLKIGAQATESSATNYENIPQRLPDDEYANAGDIGGSVISTETEVTDDNDTDVATTDDRPPSLDFSRHHRFEEDQQLYEDITHHMGMHRCGQTSRTNAKKPNDGALQKEVVAINSREKLSDGMPMVGSRAGCSVPMSYADVKGGMNVATTNSRDLVNPKEKLTEFYAGPCTPKEAERQCKAANMFRLYHRIVIVDEDQLQSVLPLFIVYKNLKGKFCHVRIVRSGKDLIKIDIEGEPKFRTLSQLITFYDIYAKFEDNLNPFPRKGADSVEDSNK